jgi:predicted DNA-binding ribbon-helix-helix protein
MNQAIGNYGARRVAPDMLKIEEDQSINPGEMRKRSVVIAGHRTSVSLENAFWSALKAIATSRRLTVNQMVTEIDSHRSGNLSSAIRLFVLESFRRRDAGRTV